MAQHTLRCATCGAQSPDGTRYCPTCNEPLDPTLIAELQSLYTELRALDAVIAAGEGDATVSSVHARYRERYLALRTGESMAPAASSTLPVAPAPVPGTDGSSAAPLTAGQPVHASQPLAQPVASAAAASAAPMAPSGPVFTWRLFLAEQVISIMAYLGGFLLLVSTLSFVVGGWQALPAGVKLGAVLAVYALFGVLGVALRGSRQLRTVGRVYLGVFALMTPLLALAIYRFELQSLNFPVAAMICISSAYAAIIYLALAWRTQFSTYAYLGWMALVVASLAVVPWADAPRDWWVPTLALLALALQAPHVLRTRGRMSDALAILATPAQQIAALTSLATVLGVGIVGIVLLDGIYPPASMSVHRAIFAWSTALLTLVVLSWSWRTRTRAVPVDSIMLDSVDVSGFASAALAVVAIASWAGVDAAGQGVVLACVAVLILIGAVVAHRLTPTRSTFRYALEALALLAACIGMYVASRHGPVLNNGSLAAALAAGVIVTLGIAVLERAPWWILAAAAFLTPDYNTALQWIVAEATLHSTTSQFPEYLALQASLDAGLALAVWLTALALSRGTRFRPFADATYVAALGIALYVTTMLPSQPDAQVIILLAFAVASFLAARRERNPLAGALTTGFFGVLAVLPLTLNAHNREVTTATMLGFAVLAVGIRWRLGRQWAYALYTIASAATLVGGIALIQANHPNETALGAPFSTWVLLAVALLATVAVLLEGLPFLMFVPAAVTVWAIAQTSTGFVAFALVLAMLAVGAQLRHLRGQWWGFAWYCGAYIASPISLIYATTALGISTDSWRVIELAVYALAAFGVALVERKAVFTVVTPLYALAALVYWPGPDTLVPTLVITFGAAALGVVVSRRLGSAWALSIYAIAIEASLFAVQRIAPTNAVADAGKVEALLLVLAAVAYVVAALERQPLAGFAPLLYAMAAVLAQHDAHVLLPLALFLAVAGLTLGRIAGPRWSWPAYAAASVTALATVLFGRSDIAFEVIALLVLALLAYLIAVLESRPDVVPVAFILGILALAAEVRLLHWLQWQSLIAFAALGWLYFGGAEVWRRIPGLRQRNPLWLTNPSQRLALAENLVNPRIAGVWLHQWSGLVLTSATCIVAIAAAHSTEVRAPEAEAVVLVLLSLAAMIAVYGQINQRRIGWYIAGEVVTVALSWQARWLGADNLQAFVLLPGSYQIVIGALVPHDDRLGRPQRLGQRLTLLGAALLLLPTLGQAFATDPNWVYALLLAIEALLLVGFGVGTRARLLVLSGSVFIGVAALRGAVLAVNSGIPIALVIGALALLLMGGATWLSLRARREAQSLP